MSATLAPTSLGVVLAHQLVAFQKAPQVLIALQKVPQVPIALQKALQVPIALQKVPQVPVALQEVPQVPAAALQHHRGITQEKLDPDYTGW
jgi:hypothetical protein